VPTLEKNRPELPAAAPRKLNRTDLVQSHQTNASDGTPKWFEMISPDRSCDQRHFSIKTI
jgi:hypothetical protein